MLNQVFGVWLVQLTIPLAQNLNQLCPIFFQCKTLHWLTDLTKCYVLQSLDSHLRILFYYFSQFLDFSYPFKLLDYSLSFIWQSPSFSAPFYQLNSYFSFSFAGYRKSRTASPLKMAQFDERQGKKLTVQLLQLTVHADSVFLLRERNVLTNMISKLLHHF